MKLIHSEWISLDEHGVCSAQYLTEVSGLSNEELDDLIDNEVIVPVNDISTPKSFSLDCVLLANRARRLRDDFELDRHGMVLALVLSRRIDGLQHELEVVRARLNSDQ